jgi:hypothetical protein
MKPSEKQFNNLPKYLQSYITRLERQVEAMENDEKRLSRLYASSDVGPIATQVLYNDTVEEIILGGRLTTVRFRLKDPKELVDVFLNDDGIIVLASGIRNNSLKIAPLSGNLIKIWCEHSSDW